MPDRPPLVEREPCAWPWCTTVYLVVLFFAAVTVPADPCDGGWTWGAVTYGASASVAVIDGLRVGVRRRDLALAILVGVASLAVALAVAMFFVYVRYAHDCVR